MVWFTGLSGAGKSSIANLVEKRLHALGIHTMLLDGDNVRHGLNRDLGFTEADRWRTSAGGRGVAPDGERAGGSRRPGVLHLPVPSSADGARMVDPGEFCEVFVDTPLDVAERRDVKGPLRKGLAAGN